MAIKSVSPAKHTTALFTIASNNYLHFARTLLQSAKCHHPDFKLYCVLVDRDENPALALSSEFESISLNKLNLPHGDEFLFQYSILELNTAVKPWAVEYLLDQGHDRVFYVDPDIYFYERMADAETMLSGGKDIIVTPHLLAPMIDDKKPSELDIRRAGTYNLGFCAVRDSENTRAFLHWWQAKLMRECVVDFERGIFVDQSWMDLVPGLFSDVGILRHGGYNVAYWNLAQRPLKKIGNRYSTDGGERLIFFHFSGLDPFNPMPFSKHQDRFTLGTTGAAKALIEEYVATLFKNGAAKYKQCPYAFSFYDDAQPIPDVVRKYYRTSAAFRRQVGSRPFSRSDALNEESSDYKKLFGKETFSNAMMALWNCRADLQLAFPLGSQDSPTRYLNWFLANTNMYFSDTVIEKHRRLWVHRENAPQAPSAAKSLPEFSRHQSSRLFGAALRSAAASRYSPFTQTHLRFLRTVGGIGLSESRLVLSRLKPMLLKAIKRGPPATVDHEPSTLLRSAFMPCSAGFYFGEASAETDGVWVDREVILPLPANAHGLMVLKGVYFPAAIKLQTGRPECHLSFMAGARKLFERTLDDEGEFSVFFQMPNDLPRSATRLRIISDAHFVPKEIGENDDTRRLAWRMKLVAIGTKVLFDHKRPEPVLSPLEVTAAPGINLIGYHKSELGLGQAVRSLAQSIRASGIPYSAIDVSFQSSNLSRDDSSLKDAVAGKFDIDVMLISPDRMAPTRQWLATEKHSSRVKIGCWAWEQPALPLHYLHAFDELDEVWAVSSFVHEAIASISPVPVFTATHAIDLTITPDVTRRECKLPDHLFLVLTMYDFHSVEYRKNPKAAIAAFRIAANKRSNIGLVVKTINADKYPEQHQALKQSVADLGNVHFMDCYLTRQEVYDLQSCCDCMMSLHRSEGFGLALAEAMFMGKPVIGTGWSGNMDFMSNVNSFPINFELRPLKKPVGPYEAGQLWAEADVEHAAHCLIRLIDDAALARRIGEKAAETIRTHFSPAAIGKKVGDRLRLLSLRYGV